MQRFMVLAAILLVAGAQPAVAQAPDGSSQGSGKPVQAPEECLPDAPSRGWCGDQGPANEALLAGPRDVSPTGTGGFLIADSFNGVVRLVHADQSITTVAGTGQHGLASQSDGKPAGDVALDDPRGVAALPGGGFLIADAGQKRIYRVDAKGILREVRMTVGCPCPQETSLESGASGPLVPAPLRLPTDVLALADGGFAFSDTEAGYVRVVSPGDVITATYAELGQPTQLSQQADGALLVADQEGGRVWRIAPDGTREVVAGAGTPEPAPVTFDRLNGVAALADGRLLAVDRSRVYAIRPGAGSEVVVGTGRAGHSADAGAGNEIQIGQGEAIALLSPGVALVADAANDRVLRVILRLSSQAPAIVRRGAGAGAVPRNAQPAPKDTKSCFGPGKPVWIFNILPQRAADVERSRVKFETSQVSVVRVRGGHGRRVLHKAGRFEMKLHGVHGSVRITLVAFDHKLHRKRCDKAHIRVA
jgi:hypothetical protein